MAGRYHSNETFLGKFSIPFKRCHHDTNEDFLQNKRRQKACNVAKDWKFTCMITHFLITFARLYNTWTEMWIFYHYGYYRFEAKLVLNQWSNMVYLNKIRKYFQPYVGLTIVNGNTDIVCFDKTQKTTLHSIFL